MIQFFKSEVNAALLKTIRADTLQHMETDVKLDALEKKIDAMYASVEKTRRYFRLTLIITIAAIVVPLIGLVFVIPFFLSTLNVSGLGL